MYSIPRLLNHVHIFIIEGKKAFTESSTSLAATLSFSPSFTPHHCAFATIFSKVLCILSVSILFHYLLPLQNTLASTPIISPAWLSLRSLGISREHKYYVGYSLLPDSHFWLHKHAHPWFFFNISGCSFEISVAHHFPFPVHLKLQFAMLNPKCAYFPLCSYLSQSNLWQCLQSLPMQTIHRAI